MEDNRYYIVRASDAGVFAGNIKERKGTEVTMTNVRNLWSWKGAASVHQIAIDGVKDPNGCLFTVVVPEITLFGVCEIIPCTETAEKVIKEVPEWRI